jgi:excisionase family DNA binding protein
MGGGDGAAVDAVAAAVIVFPEPIADQRANATDASRRLFRVIGASQRETCVVRFESAPDEPVVLPAAAVRLLGALLTELAKANAVTLMPHHADLTTQEAADLLNVSRPFLIGLLENGQLPHHKVGTHRRVRLADLMTYKRRRDAESEEALRELAALSQEMKLYTCDQEDSLSTHESTMFCRGDDCEQRTPWAGDQRIGTADPWRRLGTAST